MNFATMEFTLPPEVEMANETMVEQAEEIGADVGFTIDNDNAADWALGKIEQEQKERDRLLKIVADRREQLDYMERKVKEDYDSHTSYLLSQLSNYFKTVPHKETKTQESYKLLNGSLVMKKATIKPVPDKEKLVEYLKASAPEYVKVKEEPAWADFKKLCTFEDGVATFEGEILDCITFESSEEEFTVKF